MNLIRLAMAAALAVSGISHAYLYVHGYQHIPTIGTAFVVQASVSFALALLILIGGPVVASVGRGRAGRRRTGRVRIVAHRRPIRFLRTRMAALAARGDQRGRRTGGRWAVGGLCDRPPSGWPPFRPTRYQVCMMPLPFTSTSPRSSKTK